MMEKQVNIKSSTIEKGLDLAKEFLGKLISPVFEEVGLLLADKIKFFRFKNQIDILLKAEAYVKNKKIDVKQIPLKILTPLLENASMEDDDSLQDKWAYMIGNMADSASNLQNQIFPHILSQISIDEYEGLKNLLSQEKEYLLIRKKYFDLFKDDKFEMNFNTREAKKEVEKIEQGGFYLNLEEYENANILRLGLIRQLPPRIYIDEFKTGGTRYNGSEEEWHQISAHYDSDDYGYRITELGRKFLEVCSAKETD